MITRLVVQRMHVGSLIGRGGTVMERMKIETHTHIRVLPTNRHSPRCVATSEEIVQVVGYKNAVKHAIRIISTFLRESQLHYGNHFHYRLNSHLHLSSTSDALIPHMNSRARRSSVEGSNLGSESSSVSMRNITFSHSYGDVFESEPAPAQNAHSFSGEGIVFRILCPADKVDSLVGESNGIVDLLQNKVGVDVKVSDPVDGIDERVIIISSDEDLDDEMFPAQEALMHIQTRIVDFVQGKENFIITRLLLQSNEAGCLRLKDRTLPEMRKMTGANIEILPREDVPLGISGSYEIVQVCLFTCL
ncbi:RNA-binding KH domain-containing protein RCF3-like [Olea europaea var. sylvestris]|uniref:RNA-binding KH domain-containing protein RCF3-like n=1 Tax=Olea europaea var. sylvestris TaxID=158386 RepID=UPI000C1D4F38|nr:RNA-binding KH domain-containing protein RCF3-like [Olea europaea var. sylvestris]